MTVVTDAFPVVSEFGPGSTTCSGRGATGCAVCSTIAVLKRWGREFPLTPIGAPDAVTLGHSMGGRHRHDDPRSKHGLSLLEGELCSGGFWCAYCAYRELKSRGVPVAYGALSMKQIWDQLDAGHPIVIPGDYAEVPVIKPGSFDAKRPARGRVQASLSVEPFGHMVTAWTSVFEDGKRVGAILSDPDFAPSRVPAHSIWSAEVFERFWRGFGGGHSVCYCVIAPPPVGVSAPPPPTGVTMRTEWGAVASSRGSYLIRAGVNIRLHPHVVADNIFQEVARPTTFAAAQTTYAGTNVTIEGKGTTQWLGTRNGDRWVLKALTTLVGHTTGEEDIR